MYVYIYIYNMYCIHTTKVSEMEAEPLHVGLQDEHKFAATELPLSRIGLNAAVSTENLRAQS